MDQNKAGGAGAGSAGDVLLEAGLTARPTTACVPFCALIGPPPPAKRSVEMCCSEALPIVAKNGPLWLRTSCMIL